MARLRVGFVLFPEFAGLDVVGPLEAFATATDVGGCAGYDLCTMSLDGKAVRSESGLLVAVNAVLGAESGFDTVIIPGGRGLRQPAVLAEVAAWLTHEEPKTRRIATVCTGLYALAASGLVDGRRAATHWGYAADLAARFPHVKVVEDRLHVADGKFYTSAGVSAGIDLALHLIESDYGSQTALAVAREMVVYLRRPGSQQQFSDMLRLQYGDKPSGSGLVGWITAHIAEPIDLGRIARHLNTSRRQANRIVRDQFGLPPAKLVEQTRLDHAKTLLLDSGATPAQVAVAVGFNSVDTFRRAFVRQFGVTPRGYQTHFGGHS